MKVLVTTSMLLLLNRQNPQSCRKGFIGHQAKLGKNTQFINLVANENNCVEVITAIFRKLAEFQVKS